MVETVFDLSRHPAGIRGPDGGMLAGDFDIVRYGMAVESVRNMESYRRGFVEKAKMEMENRAGLSLSSLCLFFFRWLLVMAVALLG